MKNLYCSNCDYKKHTIDGNCKRLTADDSFAVRCAPPWTFLKHNFIKGYCEIVTKAMTDKYHMLYIDLFAGPGYYFDRNSGECKKGSPLIALENDFNRYLFADLNNLNIEALKYRTKDMIKYCKYFNEDCNMISSTINSIIPNNSLSFCLADPENLNQLKFNTIAEIASDKRMDLLINFPYWMDFKRNVNDYFDNNKNSSIADNFFGNEGWRDVYHKHNKKFTNGFFHDILHLYLNQYYQLGYKKPKNIDNFQVIRNTMNRPLYLLLYLSKHQLGYKFWKEIIKYTKGKNLEFGF